MHPTILATFLEISGTAVAMCSAGIALFLIGILAAKNDIAQARGMNKEKIVALANLCFAVPLAVFGALHLFGAQFVKDLVPPYMPGRMFRVYFVGGALIAAALSFATNWRALVRPAGRNHDVHVCRHALSSQCAARSVSDFSYKHPLPRTSSVDRRDRKAD